MLLPPCRGIVAVHGVEDAPQILPRRRVGIEAVQEKKIAYQARHPADRRRVTEHRLHAGRLYEATREGEATLAAEDAAGGEVDDSAIAALAVAREGADQRLAAAALRA